MSAHSRRRKWYGTEGFPVVPDFAGTIHSYTGENLPTGIVDCLSVEDTPRPEDQWKAYIGVSRLTSADGLLLAPPALATARQSRDCE